MKCKYCNGTGTTNWCVNGTFVDCPYCGGTGEMEVEMTNEEWFCQLPTEEKAKWLSKHFHCGDCIFEKPMCGGEYDGCKSAFVEWLKGEHK
jgi:hypothetical protein